MLLQAKKKPALLATSLRGLFCCIVTLQLLASGCATPIGVNYVNPRVAYQSLTGNILSAERPSSFSARELMNLNLSQRFENDPGF